MAQRKFSQKPNDDSFEHSSEDDLYESHENRNVLRNPKKTNPLQITEEVISDEELLEQSSENDLYEPQENQNVLRNQSKAKYIPIQATKNVVKNTKNQHVDRMIRGSPSSYRSECGITNENAGRNKYYYRLRPQSQDTNSNPLASQFQQFMERVCAPSSEYTLMEDYMNACAGLPRSFSRSFMTKYPSKTQECYQLSPHPVRVRIQRQQGGELYPTSPNSQQSHQTQQQQQSEEQQQRPQVAPNRDQQLNWHPRPNQQMSQAEQMQHLQQLQQRQEMQKTQSPCPNQYANLPHAPHRLPQKSIYSQPQQPERQNNTAQQQPSSPQREQWPHSQQQQLQQQQRQPQQRQTQQPQQQQRQTQQPQTQQPQQQQRQPQQRQPQQQQPQQQQQQQLQQQQLKQQQRQPQQQQQQQLQHQQRQQQQPQQQQRQPQQRQPQQLQPQQQQPKQLQQQQLQQQQLQQQQLQQQQLQQQQLQQQQLQQEQQQQQQRQKQLQHQQNTCPQPQHQQQQPHRQDNTGQQQPLSPQRMQWQEPQQQGPHQQELQQQQLEQKELQHQHQENTFPQQQQQQSTIQEVQPASLLQQNTGQQRPISPQRLLWLQQLQQSTCSQQQQQQLNIAQEQPPPAEHLQWLQQQQQQELQQQQNIGVQQSQLQPPQSPQRLQPQQQQQQDSQQQNTVQQQHLQWQQPLQQQEPQDKQQQQNTIQQQAFPLQIPDWQQLQGQLDQQQQQQLQQLKQLQQSEVPFYQPNHPEFNRTKAGGPSSTPTLCNQGLDPSKLCQEYADKIKKEQSKKDEHEDKDLQCPAVVPGGPFKRKDGPLPECIAAKEKQIAARKADMHLTPDMCDSSVQRRLLFQSLVQDRVPPGIIQETLDGAANFNASAFELLFGGCVPEKQPDVEPLSLLEAFYLRVAHERSLIEGCLRSTIGQPQHLNLANIDLHFSKQCPTELNKALGSLFKAERIQEFHNPIKPRFEAEIRATVATLTATTFSNCDPMVLTTYSGNTQALNCPSEFDLDVIREQDKKP